MILCISLYLVLTLTAVSSIIYLDKTILATMGEPEKDLAKLTKEQALEDAAFLDNLDKESREFDKVSLCAHTTRKPY